MAISTFERMQENIGKEPVEAGFFWSGGPMEVAPRTWFQSVFSGVTGFETDDGLVLVDSGLKPLSPMLASMLRQHSQAPVHTVVLTQGHLDHAYGIPAFLSKGQFPPRVVAHRAMPFRFARYARTAGHNRAINARQFGAHAVGRVESAMSDFGPPEMGPTQVYDGRLDLEVGGVRFELHHCRGETDDHTWVFCPDRSVLCPGDLFIWAAPNAGNPQKVQRYPEEWAHGLRQMAAVGAHTLCPGHGGPIVNDPALVRQVLDDTAEFLEIIVERTIEAMNAGSPPHVDLVHRVALPETDAPWLRNMYDDAEFIIRSVIRRNGGWWTGRPSELKPAPRAALAQEIAALAGGAGVLAKRALALLDEGQFRLAGHLADQALEAEPNNEVVQQAVARVYEARSQEESSLMASNLFAWAAESARQGQPFA
jgi:glyoxylase-like metal-dependent hydrolase (beta-lactamase superfamily II)